MMSTLDTWTDIRVHSTRSGWVYLKQNHRKPQAGQGLQLVLCACSDKCMEHNGWFYLYIYTLISYDDFILYITVEVLSLFFNL